MPAPVNMHFHRINIQSRHQLLKVAQHVGSDPASSRIAQQLTTLRLLHRSVATENVELLLITRPFLDNPISYYHVSEPIAGAPSVVAMIENRFVENQIHNRIRNVADL